jgi:hypothetical protein
MHAPKGAVLLNCDSHHFGFRYPPSEAHVRGQVSQSCNQLSVNGLNAQPAFGVRLLMPGSEHTASDRAVPDAAVPDRAMRKSTRTRTDGVSI